MGTRMGALIGTPIGVSVCNSICALWASSNSSTRYSAAHVVVSVSGPVHMDDSPLS